MATYGPYYGTADNGRQLSVEIIAVQDVESNTSTVRAILRLVSSNSTPTHSANTQIGTVINGVQSSWWQGSASYGAGTFTLADSYRVIPHDANGNASTTVVGALVHGTGTLTVTVTTLTLPNIPRGTTPAISGGGGFTTGAASTISLPRADSSYTHDVSYTFGSQSGTIASGAGVSTSWTPPHSLLTEIPNSASGTVDITVVTKQGTTVIGSKKVGFVLTAGASVVPVVSAVAWTDQNPTVASAVGAFVQGMSLINGTVSAVGAHGSTIVSKSLTVAGAAVTEAQVWQPATSGTVTASGSATDSRGRSGSKAQDFTVLAYAPPTLTQATVRRATSAAGAVGDGEWLRMDLTAQVQSLIVGTQKNALKLKVETRPTGGSWTTRNNITHSGLSYSNTLVMVTGGNVFNVAQSYEVRITITDNLGQTAVQVVPVGTGGASFDIAAAGTGHGKIWERGGIDVAGKGYFTDDVLVNDVQLSKEGHTHTGAQVAEATETARGTVERATLAEVRAGTDTTRYVSPNTLSPANLTATLGPGWSWFSGHSQVFKREPNGRVTLKGTLTVGSGASFTNMLTVPAVSFPAGDSVGGSVWGSVGYMAVASINGASTPNPGRVEAVYGTGSAGSGTYVVIDLTWWV